MTELSDEERMNDLQARARALPREIAPPADAWAAIKAEIDKPATITASRSISFWQRPVFLAAAGLALIAASSLVTAKVLRNRAAGESRVTNVAATQPSTTGPSTFAEFASAENDYLSSINRLSAILESERSTLSPETVAKLKKSLEVIDAAILEARQALAADPANKAIVEMLNNSYSQKVDLLKRTTDMGRT